MGNTATFRQRKLSFLSAIAMATLLSTHAAKADEAEESDDSFTVLMSQDAFFGFYPSFSGLIGMSDDVDFAFYGIMWTKPAFGLGPTNQGDDLWTEFGVGANFHFMDDTLMVKPQLGITNGALLSGGEINDDGDVTGSNFADGVVPSLTVNYSSDKWEAEWYSGYYLAAKNRSDNAALDFLHVWLNAGYKVTPKFSVGAHWEWLDNTRTTYPGAVEDDVYQWLGAYTQFTLPQGVFARFSAGADVKGSEQGDFYKLTIGYSF